MNKTRTNIIEWEHTDHNLTNKKYLRINPFKDSNSLPVTCVVLFSNISGWRLYMQDTSIAEFNFDGLKNHLFAIFDGHGGGQVVVFVKNHFPSELKNNPHYKSRNYQLALEETFQKMDNMLKTSKGKEEIKKIQDQLIRQDNLPKRDKKDCAGCTALVCLLTQRMMYISNAGDSEAYMKKNGKFTCLNSIHNPLIPSQKQRIEHAGGQVNQQGRIDECLNVSRSIGDLEFKANKQLPSHQQMVISFPEVLVSSLEGVEYIIMGCDGIWEQKAPIEIQKFIDKRMKLGFQLDKILEEMFDWLICKEKDSEIKQEGKDNMSAILIQFPHQNHQKNHSR